MSDAVARLNMALRGRYRIERKLGEGGMASVYLARDERHKRHVALKVLRPELAAVIGPERFLAEIETTAKLQHPHILPLFDSGDAEGLLFYVMPYVEGESLRNRLDRERQLPVDEAVHIAAKVAEALDYAHRHGVIHRDIKPANVLVPAGEPVIADFGIARALDTAGGSRLTESGLAIGTPAYMSPEQAAGGDVDDRTDLYSLGCVLYESLAGEPPFTGRTPQAITARKLTETAPNVAAHRETTPPGVAAVVEKLLARVPADRYARASLVSGDLRRAMAPGPTAVSSSSRETVVGQRKPFSRSRWRIGAAFLLLIAAGAALVFSALNGRPSTTATWLSVVLPSDVRVLRLPGPTIALSPDGRSLVFVGRGEEGQQLFLRRLDDSAIRALPGTSGAASPFYSPDGDWIGFYSGGRIRRIPITGGAAIAIVDAPGEPLGAVWSPDDRIIFTTGYRTGLRAVSTEGGAPMPVTTLDSVAGDLSHRFPQLSPDGRTLFYHAFGRSRDSLYAQNLATGLRRPVATGSVARSVGTGHLIYSARSTIFGAPFDPNRLEVTGSFRPLVEGVLSRLSGTVHFDVSAEGTLAYLPSTTAPSLVLVDSTGVSHALPLEGEAFSQPRFSPDGSRIAVGVTRDGQMDIWLYDLVDHTFSRVTFDGGASPVWTPDGSALTYVTGRFRNAGTDRGVITRRLDGLGEDRFPFELRAGWHDLGGWTESGDTLLIDGPIGTDVIGVAMFARSEIRSLVARPGVEIRGGRVSPNGRWLAYQSDETGRAEVYLTAFPELTRPYQISRSGGSDPMWANDGTELLFVSQERLLAARLAFQPTVRAIDERVALDPIYPRWNGDYDVDAAGRSFVVAQPGGAALQREIVIVQNWLDEVARTLPR